MNFSKKTLYILFVFMMGLVIWPNGVRADGVLCKYSGENVDMSFSFVNGNWFLEADFDDSNTVVNNIKNQLIPGFSKLFKNNNNTCPNYFYYCVQSQQATSVHSIQESDSIEIQNPNNPDYKPSNYKCYGYNNTKNIEGSLVNPGDSSNDCNGVFSPELLKKLQSYFNIFKIVVPIIILVLSILDFASSILNSDDDQIKKSQMRLIKRLIWAAVFFLIPTILNVVLGLFNSSVTTCGIG